MANTFVKGNGGSSICFDYDEKYIRFSRSGSLSKTLGLIDVDIPFDDVTGFVVKKASMLTAGEVYVVVNDTLLSTSTGSSFTDSYLTQISVPSSAFKVLEKELQVFCSSIKKVPIHSKDQVSPFNKRGNVNYPKANYTKKENPYETESKEYRLRCNVCGKIYCFTKSDLERNIKNAKSAKWSAVSSAANAIGGTSYDMYEQNKMANAAVNRIVDYSRCPNCNSTDITRLTDEEFQKLNAQNTQPQAPVSGADELMKFKNLLDMGVITQEEFDAKKKQLLGL